jgi:hypothetical protein
MVEMGLSLFALTIAILIYRKTGFMSIIGMDQLSLRPLIFKKIGIL